jgi:hypothetical protein
MSLKGYEMKLSSPDFILCRLIPRLPNNYDWAVDNATLNNIQPTASPTS